MLVFSLHAVEQPRSPNHQFFVGWRHQRQRWIQRQLFLLLDGVVDHGAKVNGLCAPRVKVTRQYVTIGGIDHAFPIKPAYGRQKEIVFHRTQMTNHGRLGENHHVE